MDRHMILALLSAILTTAGLGQSAPVPVRVGLDNLQTHSRLLENKRLGVITNHTGVDQQGRTTVAALSALPGVRVVALFSPEHGFDGKLEAGLAVADQNDVQRAIPIYSLYGDTRKPTEDMLKGVEVLVFDIQDVGARFYTYTSTMSVSMEAAAEAKIPFVVLDRPDPINGRTVEGPLLDNNFASFIGLHPIPVRYGLTIGELARLINQQGWLKNSVKADLTVIPMQNWNRSLWWDQTGLPFLAPSPNLRTLDAAIAYPGTCLIEGSNLSEGRGTDQPFLQFGAPWIRADELARKLNDLKLAGVRFESVHFKPTSSKFQDTDCSGCRMVITNRDAFQPFWTGVKIVETLFQLYPGDFKFRAEYFDLLCGTDTVRLAIEQHKDLADLQNLCRSDCENFRAVCKPILLYGPE